MGRVSELRLFQWAYERVAAEGALHFLTVLGGAGVGKTRLVVEAAGQLPDEPVVLGGRCLPYGNGSTFWPLAETAALGGRPDEATAAARAGLALYERKGNRVATAAVRARLGLAEPPEAGQERHAG